MGDSTVRKTDSTLNKNEDIVVCLPGARIEHVTEIVQRNMGRGPGGASLVHIGTNNPDKEGTTAIVKKGSERWTDYLIRDFTIVCNQEPRRHKFEEEGSMFEIRLDQGGHFLEYNNTGICIGR